MLALDECFNSMRRGLLLMVLLLGVACPAVAQNGGKAEPNRIEFATGRTSKVLAATLGYDQEMEYVFAAKGGQKVTIANANASLFDVRIFSEDNNVETEFDSSRRFSVILPADGDYMLYVRKKRVRTPARARFSITLTID
jgi:hypothetical protein